MPSSIEYTFDIPAFRIAYPAFANTTAFPDVTLQMYWDTATYYIDNKDYGWLRGFARYKALTLMTAHLTAISVMIADGQTPELVQSATVDKVNVSLTPPELDNQWQWWLSTTPYGAALFALLQVSSVGGFYSGGSPERLAFPSAAGFGIAWRCPR